MIPTTVTVVSYFSDPADLVEEDYVEIDEFLASFELEGDADMSAYVGSVDINTEVHQLLIWQEAGTGESALPKFNTLNRVNVEYVEKIISAVEDEFGILILDPVMIP